MLERRSTRYISFEQILLFKAKTLFSVHDQEFIENILKTKTNLSGRIILTFKPIILFSLSVILNGKLSGIPTTTFKIIYKIF